MMWMDEKIFLTDLINTMARSTIISRIPKNTIVRETGREIFNSNVITTKRP